MLQMVHPDRVVDEAGFQRLPLLEPVYPLTEGLSLNALHKTLDGALERVPSLPEWQEPAWIARERYPPFSEALKRLHRPSEPADTGVIVTVKWLQTYAQSPAVWISWTSKLESIRKCWITV